MSWYNLTVNGKQVWDSHSYLTGFVTGAFVGRVIFDHTLSKLTAYHYVKEGISCSLANYFGEKLTPYNKVVADKILKESINKETAAQLKVALKNRILKINAADMKWIIKNTQFLIKNTAGYCFNNWVRPKQWFTKKPPAPPLQQSSSENINFIGKTFGRDATKEDAEILNKLLKELKITEFICYAFTLNLQPPCEKAVRSAVTSACKAGIATGIDLSIKKIISIATLPLLYGITRAGLEYTSEMLPESSWSRSIEEGIELLPSTSTVVWGLTALHIAAAGALFWHLLKYSESKPHDDKEKIEKQVLKLSKDSIAKKIGEFSLFKTFNIELNPQTKSEFSEKLIHQAVEFYFPKLNQVKYLGIPLVS